MLLYADENFNLGCVHELRQLGYDVVTVAEDGRLGSPDPDVLARAFALGRIVLTYNRWDFEKLHRQKAPHCGILTITPDDDLPELVGRIHAALAALTPGRWCKKVYKPSVNPNP